MTTTSHTFSLPELRGEITGQVIGREDAEYDDARRIFFGTIDRRPEAVVRVADEDDVRRVVRLARDTGLELAVRSGGHSGAGHSVSEGGIVLDLSQMKAIDIDVEGRTAWAETGLTAGEYTTAVGEHDLVTGLGDTGSVGIGGITLGGGIGFLVRKFGMTIDDVLAAEIVTADGELLRVDNETHADLFWAIRGGGGNFGVVTRFQFRLHELPRIVGGMLMLPATADNIVAFMVEAEAAPEELSCIANVMIAPPMPFIPEEHQGKLVIMALMAYAGGAETGEQVLAPFRSIATPIVDMLQEMPYSGIYQPDEEGYHPIGVARTMFVDEIDTETAQLILDRIEEHVRSTSAQMAVAQLRPLGGAMARVPDNATAFAHRSSPIMVNTAALVGSVEELPEHTEWVEDFAASLNRRDGAYVGFLADEGEARVRAAYPGTTWDRLAEIKRRYDPENLFRLNQNVPPDSGTR